MHRLEKAIQRLDGVAKVTVRLQPARAEVTPRGGLWLDADRLRGAVRSAGFKPGEISYTAAGWLTEWHGEPALRLSGSARVIVLEPGPREPAARVQMRHALLEARGQEVEVEGQLVDPAGPSDRTEPETLRIARIPDRK